MQSQSSWLTKLKATELHRLAVLIGTPCSGTKPVRIRGIQDALTSLYPAGNAGALARPDDLGETSLVSIDMGVRNLAYSHWTAHVTAATSKSPAQYSRPILQSWRKINISSWSSAQIGADDARTPTRSILETTSAKESFEPGEYAAHAYKLIDDMLREHKPTRILIERQRFRSGGGSAVLEWTIRVGVFEGMLYAVLKSLAEERHLQHALLVEPMLPARVNRYWFEGRASDGMLSTRGRNVTHSAREVKQAKIALVRRLLIPADNETVERLFHIGDDAHDMATAFLEKRGTPSKPRKQPQGAELVDSQQGTVEISKFDDLADCLLQGLAWFQWQNNRFRLQMLKQDASGLLS